MKTPVLIAARNEASEIGMTLDRLPSENVEPIVIPNGCTDNTADVAESFGVKVLDSDATGKMEALQGGIKYLGRRALEPFITLDADARPLFPKRWIDAMHSERMKLDADKPAIVVGFSIYTDVDPLTAFLRAAAHFKDHYRNRRHPTNGGFCGRNMLFDTRNQDTVDMILGLENYWPREDVAMKDSILVNGGRSVKSTNLYTSVTTSGKRFGSFVDRLRYGNDGDYQRVYESYLAEGTEDTMPYVGSPLLDQLR